MCHVILCNFGLVVVINFFVIHVFCYTLFAILAKGVLLKKNHGMTVKRCHLETVFFDCKIRMENGLRQSMQAKMVYGASSNPTEIITDPYIFIDS